MDEGENEEGEGELPNQRSQGKGLIERLKQIAREEGIPETDLIWDEAHHFLKEHRGHGIYDMKLGCNQDGTLEWIELECQANEIVDTYKCIHQNPETGSELCYSIIYGRRATLEMDAQRERRENAATGEYG